MSAAVTFDNTSAVISRLRARIGAAVATAAFNVEADAKTAIQSGSKTGREYKRGKKVHKASAPGESPATDTGNLVNSGFTRRVSPLRYLVGFSAEYAKLLELGTSRVAARPYLMPALAKERANLRRVVRRIVKGR